MLPTEARRDSVGVSGQSLSFVNPVCLVQVIDHEPSKDWASDLFSALICSVTHLPAHKQRDLVDHFLAPPCSSRSYFTRLGCSLHCTKTVLFAVFHLVVSFIHNVHVLPFHQVHRERDTPLGADEPTLKSNIRPTSTKTNTHTLNTRLLPFKRENWSHCQTLSSLLSFPTQPRRESVASQGKLPFVTQSVRSFMSLSMCQAGTGLFRPHKSLQLLRLTPCPLSQHDPLSRPIFFPGAILQCRAVCFLHRTCTLPTLRSCSPTPGYRLHPRNPCAATPSSSPIPAPKNPVARSSLPLSYQGY